MQNTKTINFPEMVNSHIVLYDNYFPEEVSDKYFNYLKDKINWKQESMFMYGKKVDFARLTAWYGEKGKPYSFSGITLQPENWEEDKILIQILNELIAETGTQFNSVLLNYYRGGKDSISWHSDNEKELGENPTIASVSFGCERTFKMRRYEDNSDVHNIMLKHGSLLLMDGETQHHWQHMIPKQKLKVDELGLFDQQIKNGIERINLTFRKIII